MGDLLVCFVPTCSISKLLRLVELQYFSGQREVPNRRQATRSVESLLIFRSRQ